VAVRPGPDPPPVAAGPVQHVVRAPARLARRPVRDLVPAQARAGERLVRGEVALGQHVVVGRGQLTAPDPGGQPGPGFHGERVGGQVIGPGVERGLQRAPPVRARLPRGPVDQVEADVGEAGRARPRGAPRRAARLVHPVEDGQHPGHRALHPERHARDALGPQFGQAGLVDALRVGLRRDLGPRGQPEFGVDGPQHGAERGRRQQRRRAAAEEHRAHREVGRAQDLAGEYDLRDRQGGITLRRDARRARAPAEFGGGVGVEIAVATARCAERHVHINPERPRPEPAVRAVRQGPVRGYRLTLRQRPRHINTVPADHGPPPVRTGGSGGTGGGEPPVRGGILGVGPPGASTTTLPRDDGNPGMASWRLD
jgi:hypothetical protein